VFSKQTGTTSWPSHGREETERELRTASTETEASALTSDAVEPAVGTAAAK
jgi:hypothetical protein